MFNASDDNSRKLLSICYLKDLDNEQQIVPTVNIDRLIVCQYTTVNDAVQTQQDNEYDCLTQYRRVIYVTLFDQRLLSIHKVVCSQPNRNL